MKTVHSATIAAITIPSTIPLVGVNMCDHCGQVSRYDALTLAPHLRLPVWLWHCGRVDPEHPALRRST